MSEPALRPGRLTPRAWQVAVGVYRLFAFWATLPTLAALVLLPRAGSRLQQLRAEPSVT